MEPLSIPLATETLIDIFKFFTYNQLVNCRPVCAKWSQIIQTNRYYLCCPYIYSLIMSSSIGPPKFSVTNRPDCFTECEKAWDKDEAYLNLLGKNILPTMPDDNKITMSFTWLPSRQFLIDYSSREFILTCANKLTPNSLPHVLHWFKHFRDHDAYIQQVVLLSFSLPLWDLTSLGYEHETIRCKFFNFQHFDEQHVFVQTLDFLMRHIRSQETVIEFQPQASSLDNYLVEEKLIAFLCHGSKVATGQIIVIDFISDKLLQRFIEDFESLPNTNFVIPAIQFSFARKELEVSTIFEKSFTRKTFNISNFVTKNVYEFFNSKSNSVLEVLVEDLKAPKMVEMYLKYLLK